MTGASKDLTTRHTSAADNWDDQDDAGVEVSPIVVDAVGRALQAHFQSIADMPLPDRLLVLLAELEASERRS